MATTMELLDPAVLMNAVERELCARRAALAARKYKGTWLALARAMSRNPKLRLEFTSGASCTDGNVIYLQVPIELGAELKHQLRLCGERDDLLVQKCEACAVHEEVFITIIHEVAHLVFGTFHTLTEQQKVDAIKLGIEMECRGKTEGSRAAKIRKNIENAPPRIQSEYLGVASMISPFLPLVVNAVEDSRVNLATERIRKGTRIMFAASHGKIIQRGVKVSDDKTFFLKEAQPNMQALTAVFFMTSGIDFAGWMDPDIEQRLNDPILHGLCEEAKKVKTITGVYQQSVPILERLRELGFCLSPDDEEDDPEPEPEPQAGDGEGGEGEPSDDATESSDTGQESSGSSSGDASGTSQPDTQPSPETGDKDSKDSEESSDGTDESEEEGEGDGSEGDGGDDQESDDTDQREGSGAGDDAQESDGDSDSGTQSESSDSGSDDTHPADSQQEGDTSGDSGSSPSQPQPSTGASHDEGGVGTEGDYLPPGDYYSQDQYEQDGTAEDVAEGMQAISGHDKFGEEEDQKDKDLAELRELMEKALNQAANFDKFSNNLSGLHLWHFGDDGAYMAWEKGYTPEPAGATPESVLSPALMRLRLAFTDNRRGRKQTGLHKGRIDGKALRRTAFGDTNVFRKKTQPAKKDYFVVVGFDISGSTGGHTILLIKAAVKAQAELLSRLGVKFAIYAHSSAGDYVDIFEVKAPTEPWATKAKEALDKIDSFGYNLDGHSLEFYRKVAQQRLETDKVVLFYTDGQLNRIGEEFEVFSDNVHLMRRQGITCVGVEVGTNSGMSEALGMDTVRIDSSLDIVKVVQELEKRIG